ncbi:MAG: c-type cytochrome [Paracoccus sp. (in: a-proteobacteria)]
MFDTMTITKAAGALIGALLFLLLANWAASGVYHVGTSGGHGEEDGEHAQAYTIPVEEAAGGGAGAEEEQIDFGALMAQADVAAGEKDFGKCKACHKLDGTDGTGPHLNGVVGRDVASVGGFGYSDAMHAHAGEAPQWTPEALQEFLTNPKSVVKGTKMSFAGLKNPQDRADLIAYLAAQQ